MRAKTRDERYILSRHFGEHTKKQNGRRNNVANNDLKNGGGENAKNHAGHTSEKLTQKKSA
ncbi:MAG: hypothetical protein Q8P07_02375 [bacterium]|nr:hypothetical protein [bacterium]